MSAAQEQPDPLVGRAIVAERRHSRWAVERRVLRVVRLTDQCVVATEPDGAEAWFARTTGAGQRGGNGRAASRSRSWLGWKLRLEDLSAFWVEPQLWIPAGEAGEAPTESRTED